MGCWNKTCGLSNLHILAGSPVYVFVLERNKDYNPCYSTALFRPLLLPFESVYNDYGGGEDSGGAGLELVMKGLREYLVEMDVGENEYHDIAVKRDQFGPELFFDAVHEDRLQIRSPGAPTSVYFTMFRRDIVDHVLGNRTIQDWVGRGLGTCGQDNAYIRYRFSDVKDSLGHLIEFLRKDTKPFGVELFLDRHRDQNLAAQYLLGVTSSSHRYSNIVNLIELLDQCRTASSDDLVGLQAVLTDYLKGIFLDRFIQEARRLWVPGCHEGSQSFSSGALSELYAATMCAIACEEKEFGDEELE